jgi:replication factor C large subunit
VRAVGGTFPFLRLTFIYADEDAPAMLDWAEKHRPRTLEEVVGNKAALGEMRNWADAWVAGNPKRKALVLSGPPGIGKTTAALALAHDYGWGAVEMNASDSRTAKRVQDVALRGALYDTFSVDGEYIRAKDGGRKLIVIDEADNLFVRVDRGGGAAISEVLRETQQPVILIVNDYYELTRKSSAVRSLAKQVKFPKASPASIRTLLRRIAGAEEVRVSDEAVEYLAEACDGDIRAAVNDLQALSEGREALSLKDIEGVGTRDSRLDNWSALREIFRGRSCRASRERALDIGASPEEFILWVDENLPYEYRDLRDLSRGYRAVTKADVYLGRVRRRQNYTFWGYASDMLTCGVTAARIGRYTGVQYRFPSWLGKMSRSRGSREAHRALSAKIASHCRTSIRRAFREILPHFRELFRRDRAFRISMVRELGLDERDVATLLGEKPDSHAVRHVMEEVDKVRAAQAKDGEAAKKEGPKGLFAFGEEE